ncbi:hypothetical protein EV715DRAFT_244995 [Schizophyllum commune]
MGLPPRPLRAAHTRQARAPRSRRRWPLFSIFCSFVRGLYTLRHSLGWLGLLHARASSTATLIFRIRQRNASHEHLLPGSSGGMFYKAFSDI